MLKRAIRATGRSFDAYRSSRAAHALHAAEYAQADADTRVYWMLAPSSIALAITARATQERQLNLVVPGIRVGAAFAGITTALEVATGLSQRLGLRVRVVMTNIGEQDPQSVRAWIKQRFDLDVDVIPRESLRHAVFGDDDLWVATHWTTAHALQISARLGHVSPDRVIYLIQDYEPGFSPWSTDFALARNTYHAGFTPLVNSSILASYLREHEDVEVDEHLVFGPTFDLSLLHQTQGARRAQSPVRVLFYARPSKPRNLYHLGLASLRAAVRELGSLKGEIEFISAGEAHADVDLGRGAVLTSAGTLPWDDYFQLLTTTHVVLSLQHSPHPSHPPFDAAISGAIAVTNEFGATRGNLHERLIAVQPDADALGAAVAEAINRVRLEGPGPFAPLSPGLLGRPLAEALDALAAR